MSRNKALDAIRGIAAVSVLFAHALETSNPASFGKLSQFVLPGIGGVYLFFLISGYVISISASRSANWLGFAIQRFFRLYPLFLFSLVAAVVLIKLGYPEWWLKDSLTTVTLFNLTMVQEFLGRPSIMGLYWSLGYEVVFYALFAFLILTRKIEHAWKLAIVGAGVLLIGVIISFLRGKGLGGDRFVCFELMFVGCAARAWHAKQISRGAGIFAISLGFIAIQLQWLSAIMLNPNSTASYAGMLTMLLVFATFLIALGIKDEAVPRTLVYVGEISFSIYLMHGLVNRILSHQSPPFAVHFLALLALTLLISAATYKWIEQPFIAIGKRITKKPKLPKSDQEAQRA